MMEEDSIPLLGRIVLVAFIALLLVLIGPSVYGTARLMLLKAYLHVWPVQLGKKGSVKEELLEMKKILRNTDAL